MSKKEFVASLLCKLKISEHSLKKLNRQTGCNYIRAVNYHEIYDREVENFERQVAFLAEHFQNCNYEQFEQFVVGKYRFTGKPGLMITFDDGFRGNYTNAMPILEKYGFTGWFMVSAGKIGNEYMTEEELKDLIRKGHVIGCHTYSHHRMNVTDTDEVLDKEIIQAKDVLEQMTGCPVTIFCWCGGESGTYTQKASRYVDMAGYKYSFMTDSYPIYQQCNPKHIQRTNIQSYWNLDMVRIQISGITDKRYRKKRLLEEQIV